ncbi:MAG TPA: cation-transporting P-type ATPase, partial [Candidatus Methanoperedens sp.]|nr:cation-transporting P-type ATPase [Candidatus Methanoperedens sp.]
MLNSWHAVEGEVILHRLGADAERGLAPAESSRRLRELGPNSLHAVHDPPRQNLPPRLLPSLPVLLLLAAAALCARLGDWAAALVAAALAAANALLGSRQQQQHG